jgi:hypothetical protein
MKKQHILLGLALTVMLMLTGCGALNAISEFVNDLFPSAVEQTIRVLEDAVDALNQNSGAWQNTLTNAIDKLTAEAQSTVRNELNNMLQRGIAAVSSELRCNVDFIGNRIRYNILAIIARLQGTEEMPPLEPYLCNVVPLAIDVSLVPTRLNMLEFYGYDFDAQGVSAYVVKTNGGKINVTSKLNRPTHYHMTLNLGGNGIQLPANAKSINLYFNNEEISSIAVIQPSTPVCTSKAETVTPGSFTYIPPCTRGDSEFDGHGPNVYCSVKLVHDENKVNAVIYMKAEETKKDWTTAAGQITHTLYTVPAGWKIERLNSVLQDSISYRDSNHSPDIFERGNTGPVKKYTFVGDTKGKEAGTRTKVDIVFNQINVELKQTGNCVGSNTLQILDKLKLLSTIFINRMLSFKN